MAGAAQPGAAVKASEDIYMQAEEDFDAEFFTKKV